MTEAAKMTDYITSWQELICEPYPWVVFENGTCVILVKPGENQAEEAIAILKSLNRNSGEEFGDFGVQELDMEKGWIVTSPHPDIVSLVTFDEVPEESRNDTLAIGFHGKAKRKLDYQSCKIIHVGNGQ